MSGSGQPPEGSSKGARGGDDEFRSTVFDESFVRAARIREFSARERMDDAGRPVATLGPLSGVGRHRQAVVLVLLMLMAFGSAVYLGVRHPYRPAGTTSGGPLRVLLTPLTPSGPVPVAGHDPLFTAAHAAAYRTGPAGITLPAPRATTHFTTGQVREALALSKDYLVDSALDAAALTGGDLRDVRNLLNPADQKQFDRSLAWPADDGRYAATGWLIRFDPSKVVLADPRIRIQGSVVIREHSAADLEVATDHTMVYTVRPAAERHGPASYFTVRRQLQLLISRADLKDHQVEVERADLAAGPLDCSGDPAAYFRPLLAGQTASSGAGTDPYDHHRPIAAACQTMPTPPSPPPGPTSAAGGGRLEPGG